LEFIGPPGHLKQNCGQSANEVGYEMAVGLDLFEATDPADTELSTLFRRPEAQGEQRELKVII